MPEARLLSQLKAKLSSAQNRNVLSMVGAEAVSKLTRIATLLAMAAFLLPAEYGTAMLALACHDMIRLVLRCGAGAQLVQCSDDDLPEYARNAVILQFTLSFALALLQFNLATVLGGFYDNAILTALLQQLAWVYVLYPLVSVRVFLIQRSNKLGYFGFCNGLCVSTENLSIAALLVLGAGAEVVVYGKFIYALLWIALFIRVPIKTYGIGYNWQVFKRLLNNSGKLLQSEVSRSMRINGDVLIAGKLLSPDIFGLYSFAKSASIALSQALSNAVVTALYPQFCKMHREGVTKTSVDAVTKLMLLVVIAYCAQAALAPFYIQWVFQDTWLESISSAVWLSLSAVPLFLIDMICVAQRANGAFALESKVRFGHLCVLVAALGWMQPETPVLIAQTVFTVSTSWWLVSMSTIKRPVFNKSNVPLCGSI